MKLSTLALLAGTMLAPPALAQDRGGWTPDDIVVTGEREGYAAREATVTRTLVPLNEVPQSVQVLTRELIRDQELVTLDEALRNVSGVVPSLPSEAVLANPIVRGFEAEIFTDGLIGYGDTAVIDSGSLWHVDRIEVAKGPTATLFGGGTGAPVGGLINLVSKTANSRTAFSGRVRAGSFDERSAAIDGNLVVSPAAAIRIVGEVQSAGDHIDRVGIDRMLIAPSFRLAPAIGTEIIGRLTFSSVSQLEYAGLPAQFRNDPRIRRDRFTGATNAPRTQIENLTLQLELNQRLAEGVTLSLRGRRYENDFREYASSPFFAFFPCAGTTCPQIRGQLPAKVDEWTFDGAITAQFSTGGIEHVVLAGVQHDQAFYDAATGFDFATLGSLNYANPASDFSFFPVPTLTRFVTNRYTTFAGYLQDQITIADRVHVLGSLRYSRLKITELAGGAGTNQSYHQWDPRVGVTVDLVEGLSVFAGYATGSRLSIFFTGTRPPRPERSESFEGGLKLGFAGIGLSGTIAAYRIDRTNVPTPDPTTFFTSIQTGRQRSEGVEIDLIYEPSRAFSLLASYAYTNARVLFDTVIPAGSRLTRVPEHRGRLAARYRFLGGALSGFELGGGVSAASSSFATLPNATRIAGYAIVDAQASYRVGPARIGLRVDNLLNERYFLPYQYFAQDVVRPGNPRSAFVTLGFDF